VVVPCEILSFLREKWKGLYLERENGYKKDPCQKRLITPAGAAPRFVSFKNRKDRETRALPSEGPSDKSVERGVMHLKSPLRKDIFSGEATRSEGEGLGCATPWVKKADRADRR